MSKSHVLGAVLSASMALTMLAGCNVPTLSGPTGGNASLSQPGTKNGSNGTMTGGQTSVGSQTTVAAPTKVEAREGAAQAIAEERTLGDYDVMAGQVSAALNYGTLMVGQPKPEPGMVAITSLEAEDGRKVTIGANGEITATRADGREVTLGKDGQMTATRGEDKVKLDGKGKVELFKGKLKVEVRTQIQKRRDELEKKAAPRLEKLKGDRDKMHDKAKGAKWVDNGDGTETMSYSFSESRTVNGKTQSRSVSIERTRNAESKDLLASSVKVAQTEPSGLSRTSERTVKVDEAGVRHVEFHTVFTFKDGTSRKADWSKQIALDGKVSGTGTIVWTDKDGKVTKTVNVNLNGTEEAPAADAGGETVTPEAPEATVPADGAASDEAEAEATTAADATAETKL